MRARGDPVVGVVVTAVRRRRRRIDDVTAVATATGRAQERLDVLLKADRRGELAAAGSAASLRQPRRTHRFRTPRPARHRPRLPGPARRPSSPRAPSAASPPRHPSKPFRRHHRRRRRRPTRRRSKPFRRTPLPRPRRTGPRSRPRRRPNRPPSHRRRSRQQNRPEPRRRPQPATTMPRVATRPLRRSRMSRRRADVAHHEDVVLVVAVSGFFDGHQIFLGQTGAARVFQRIALEAVDVGRGVQRVLGVVVVPVDDVSTLVVLLGLLDPRRPRGRTRRCPGRTSSRCRLEAADRSSSPCPTSARRWSSTSFPRCSMSSRSVDGYQP